MKTIVRFSIAAAVLSLVAGCQKAPPPGGLKVGKPYTIEGKTYYPEYDPGYDKVGTASWYGPGFHGKFTANGEKFDQNDLTAAHPTLPMPSLVRVTNLENDRTAIIRVNDRGPFKGNRIIDLSKKSAQTLGVVALSKVRVQYLKPETEAYIASVKSKTSPQVIDMAAYNTDYEKRQLAAALPQPLEPTPEESVAGEPSQIVENNVANTHAGQVVTDAAPIMSVNASEEASASPASNLNDKSGQPVRSFSLVRPAYADDDTPEPLPKENKEPLQPSIKSPVTDRSPQAQAPLPPTSEARPVELKMQEAPKLTPASGGGRNSYIQAGSFATEINARKLSDQLSSYGTPSVAMIDTGGKTWWRVRLGPFASRDAAQEALTQVRTSGAPDAHIVQP